MDPYSQPGFNEKFDALIDAHKERLPTIPIYYDDPKFPGSGDLETALGPGMQTHADNLIPFLTSISDEAEYTRDALAESLAFADIYRAEEAARSEEETTPEEELVSCIFFHREREKVAFYGARKTGEVISGIYNLWEYSAHLLRTAYEIEIPFFDVTLDGVLRIAHRDERFRKLIAHAEFAPERGGAYMEGGVLERLKRYRHPSVHILSIPSHAAFKDFGKEPEQPANPFYKVWIDDFMSGKRVYIDIPHPDVMLAFAEVAYRHYVDGYGIIRDLLAEDIRQINSDLEAGP